jgi:hypothetical protein
MQTRGLIAERQRLDTLLRAVFDDLRSGKRDPDSTASVLWPKDLDPLPGWPPPAAMLKPIVDREVTEAVAAARRSMTGLGLTNVSTGLSAYPRAALDFDKPGPEAPEFAPLLSLCLDQTIFEGMAWYMGMAHSSFSRKRGGAPVDLYPGDAAIVLMERANAFLETEAMLWTEARAGGYCGPVPYAIRYESARYLWSATIAGVAFCLRCGEVIRYQRRGRQTGKGPRKVPVCARCVRSQNLNWPKNALAADTRRTWWLRCVKCGTLFVGGGNREYCDEHRR